jgi:polycomb protein EED
MTDLFLSVAFYGDQILSRACYEDAIVMWRIEGFSSKDPPLPQSTAPTGYEPARVTRSAFMPSSSSSQYTRLLEFLTPGCGLQFFMRFKLHFTPEQNPLLAFCNAKGQIFFWDFERLTGYNDYVQAINNSERDQGVPVERPSWLEPIQHRNRQDMTKPRVRDTSDKDSLASGQTGGGGITSAPVQDKAMGLGQYSQTTQQSWEGKYNIEDPHQSLKPHKEVSLGAVDFVGRQVAWSPGGDWCVVVGSSNRAHILQRWSKKDAARRSEVTPSIA